MANQKNNAFVYYVEDGFNCTKTIPNCNSTSAAIAAAGRDGISRSQITEIKIKPVAIFQG